MTQTVPDNRHAPKPRRAIPLALSAMLAVLTVGIGRASAQSFDDVTRIRVLSTAQGHEPVPYGPAAAASAILIDDMTLRRPASPGGLRVAVAQADGEVRSSYFRLADRAGEVERLEQLIDDVAPGEALALSIHQSITPTGRAAQTADAAAAPQDRLAALLKRIGAKAAPVGRTGVSWAYIALRLETQQGARRDEWVNLAESVSASRGVSVSFMLGADRRRYAGYVSHLITEGECRVLLLDRWPTLTPMPDTWREDAVAIGGRELPAIFAHPPYRPEVLAGHPHGENRILFEEVALGDWPRLTCSLGIREEHHDKSDGVVFSLAVDGKVVASRILTAGAEDPPAWHDWTVDLAEYAGRTVALELRTGPNGNTDFDHAFWGNPAVISGSPPASASKAAPNEHRIVYIGHAYPINGFDKRRRGAYLGWDTTDDTYLSWGKSLRRRIQIDNSPAARADFYGAIQALEPVRLIWGGDTLYAPGAAANEHLRGMLAAMGTNHVVLPGNHDAPAAADPGVLELCAAAAGQDEAIGGVRLMYVDTTRSGDRSIVSKALCAPDQPWIDALTRRLNAATTETDVYGVIVMLHHAPWLAEAGVANVVHDDDWWGREIQPALRALEEAGIEVVVLAGDAGDNCMADGRQIDGVTYVVTGQPRFDSDVLNGFVEVVWGPSRPGLTVRVHGWAWGRQPETWEPQSDAWQY